MSNFIKVASVVKLSMGVINQLSESSVTALEQTAEALHTDIVQAQVVPRDTGNLQNESFSIDTSQSSSGKVSLVHSTPYARRLYYHPEYHFKIDENPNAKGKWFEDWEPGGRKEDFARNAYAQIYGRISGV